MLARSTILRALTTLSISGLFSPQLAPAQLPPAGSMPLAPASGASAESAVPEFEGLLLLPSETVPVRYPPGALDRAARVQARLEAVVSAWSPFVRGAFGWSAVVLRREDWERAGLGGGWGAPRRIGESQFAVPAEGDAGTVAFAHALVGRALPDPGGDPVIGSREEAASLIVSDLLLQLEAARAFAALAPLSGDSPWLTGVLMQLAVRYAWERAEPEQTLGYVAIFDAVSTAHGGPRARRLDDYRSELPYETELWYQAQFVRGADAIWVESGRLGVARRLDAWTRKREPVAAAELEKKYPALALWKQAAFAP